MELDDEQLARRAEATELAADLRARALAVDAHPDRLVEHLDSPALQAVRQLDAVSVGSLNTVVSLVELARGDAGLVLAAPGPALAGVLVNVLGDDEQRERLAKTTADGRTWAYLAITEPHVGSDATRLRTELRPDGHGGFRLHGTKRFIGNGARGTVGVVLARTGPGPLALRTALVEGTDGITARPLDMIGLRGAEISELTFDGVPVRAEDLLGGGLPAMRRGMWGVMQAFNTVRVQVAAMAVGTALAVLDLVTAHAGRDAADELAAARVEVEAVCRLTFAAAAEVDADRAAGYRAAMAKLAAVRVARRVCAELPRLLGRGALLDHPLLEKWSRDVAAFEFMEGTSDIQRGHVATGFLRSGPA